MTAPSEDAVGVAREKAKFIGFVERAGFMDPNQFPDEMKALDALIAAVESRVRAECAAKVEELRVGRGPFQTAALNQAIRALEAP